MRGVNIPSRRMEEYKVSPQESQPFLGEINQPPQNPHSLYRILSFHVLTIIITSTIWMLVIRSISLGSGSTKPTHHHPQTKILHCGNSTAEARALGCEYDVLPNLWIPAPCLDPSTTNSFTAQAPYFHGYSTPEGGKLLTVDEMSERTDDQAYYTSGREHLIHCAMMWQRLHKGYLTGRKILDKNTKDWEHTMHCSQMMIMFGEMEPWELNALSTRTTAGFSSCEIEF